MRVVAIKHAHKRSKTYLCKWWQMKKKTRINTTPIKERCKNGEKLKLKLEWLKSELIQTIELGQRTVRVETIRISPLHMKIVNRVSQRHWEVGSIHFLQNEETINR